MDPASVVITFVGFAASISTLGAAVIDSSRTLYNLQAQLKNAPDDVHRLLRQLRIFETLLGEIQIRSQEYGNLVVPEPLQEIWRSSAAQIEDDVHGFAKILAGLQRRMTGPRISSTLIRLRLVKFFYDEDIARFERHLSNHYQTLKIIQLFISDLKLDVISMHTRELQSVSDAAFKAICSRLAVTETLEVGRNEAQLLSIARVEQLLQRQLEIGPLRTSSISVSPKIYDGSLKDKSETDMAATVYLKTRSCVLPFGRLRIDFVEKRQRDPLQPPTSPRSQRSRTNLRKNSATSFPSINVSLTPISINYNVELPRRILEGDVPSLRQLFVAGLARPTDHVPYFGAGISLITLLASTLPFHYSHGARAGLLDMYQFLLSTGATLTADELIWFFNFRQHVDDDFPHSSKVTWRNYLEAAVAHDSFILTNVAGSKKQSLTLMATLVSGAAGFDCIDQYLCRQSEPWTVDGLVQIDRWLIGILAHTNYSFSARLKSHVEKYKSPFIASTTSSTEQIVRKAFGISNIVAQVMAAPVGSRISFLQAVVAPGTPAMLKPFLDERLDVDEGRTRYSYLGTAAACGNLATFQTILDAGASTALALPRLLKYTSASILPDFRYCLTSIIDRITRFELEPCDEDPVISVLKSRPAFRLCPHALEVLRRTNNFRRHHIYGSRTISLDNSYMWTAIVHDRPDAVQLLLEYGIPTELRIGDQFGVDTAYWKYLGDYTWLTLAMDQGQPSCIEVMAPVCDVTVPDGSGRSALDLSRSYATGDHPWRLLREDSEVLAILEKSLTTRTEFLRAVRNSPDASGLVCRRAHYTSPLNLRLLWLQAFKDLLWPRKFLRFIGQVISEYSNWSYSDALLVCLGYIVPYCVLLCYETISVILWMRRPPKPRGTLIGAVVLLLYVLWCLRFREEG
ncbi:hypothetical protein MMC30_008232 [Trapelia coarctata]|nr:hypothetical protein [Trapelia coarctata]